MVSETVARMSEATSGLPPHIAPLMRATIF
jgi:hypothetical protein